MLLVINQSVRLMLGLNYTPVILQCERAMPKLQPKESDIIHVFL
jgi:hypothetical protein